MSNIWMTGAKIKETKAGNLINAKVHCETLIPIEEILEWLNKETKLDNWLYGKNSWDGEKWTWEVWAFDFEGKTTWNK